MLPLLPVYVALRCLEDELWDSELCGDARSESATCVVSVAEVRNKEVQSLVVFCCFKIGTEGTEKGD